MDTGKEMSRRTFIRSSLLAGSSFMLSGILSSNANNYTMQEHETDDGSNESDSMLKGVCDIHIHAAPDSRMRSVDEWHFAQEARKAGYRAVMYKSNDFSCHDRAFVIRQGITGIEVFGSLCMNRIHGDRVNAYAAEKAVATSGGLCRCIWMPTLDAEYHYRCEGRAEKCIPVLDDSGKVLPEVIRVMEICAEANIIFATGHCSPRESIIMARQAAEVGVKRFVVTHANSHFWTMTHDQIRQCVDLGAYIEYCYLPCLWGHDSGMPQYERQSAETLAAFVRIAPERSFITTDLGQSVMPHPIAGMKHCISDLRKAGISDREIDLLVRKNPAYIVGLNK